MSNDKLSTFIRKKGSIKGKSELFKILLDNKYFKVKDNNYFEYLEKEKSNTLRNVSIYSA